MNILITGICGFVGSEIATALLSSQTSLNIVGIDNFSRNGAWLNRDKLTHQGVRVIHGDIRNEADLEALGPFDWIIDAAANPSVLAGVDGKSSSRQLIDNNLGGTINLLEACKRWGAGFILLSTSRVYSIPPLSNLDVEIQEYAYVPASKDTMIPGLSASGITEEFSTVAPVSLYGASKLTSEMLALEYGMTFDFPVWINRCGVMAGAGQFGKPDQGIFAFWIHSWREEKPLKYIGFDGLGHQVRDCLHPRDLAPLLLKQMGKGRANNQHQATPQVINLSGGADSAMSLRQLSDWCNERFPSSLTMNSLPQSADDIEGELPVRPFDLPWVVLDHSLATETWDWEPQSSVFSIFEEIAAFADANPGWLSISR